MKKIEYTITGTDAYGVAVTETISAIKYNFFERLIRRFTRKKWKRITHIQLKL